jgi:hypothetical protein
VFLKYMSKADNGGFMIVTRKIELSAVRPEDKRWVDELLSYSDFQRCQYCFANLFNWQKTYKTELGRCGDFLIVRSGHRHPSYLYPAGRGDLREVIETLMADAEARGEAFRLHGIGEAERQRLEDTFHGMLDFTPMENYYDYVYAAEKLRTLAGKKLHAKRNHINRFKEQNPDWSYEKIGAHNMEEVRAMSREWCIQNDCQQDDALKSEACAVKSALTHYEALELKGGLLRAGGRVVAFTLGGRLNSDTFDVCVEKAFSDIQGAYPMINQQFVIHEMESYAFVNREDDTGDEGLRKSKLSYYPERLLYRWAARIKGQDVPHEAPPSR